MRIADDEKAVSALRDALCKKFCSVCPNSCCSGRLGISVGDNINFRDLQVIRSRWQRPPASEAYITDRRFLFWGKKYLVGRCPYFSDDGSCGIHAKTDRPKDCVLYPLYISRYPFSFERIIKAEKSCFIFSDPSACRKVIELGQKLGLKVFFAV